jgi:hypothetical protein
MFCCENTNIVQIHIKLWLQKLKNRNYVDDQRSLPWTYILVQIQIHREAKRFYLSLYISTDERVTKNVAKVTHPYTPYFFLCFLEPDIYTANIIWVISLFFPLFFVFIFYGHVILLQFFVLFFFVIIYNLFLFLF